MTRHSDGGNRSTADALQETAPGRACAALSLSVLPRHLHFDSPLGSIYYQPGVTKKDLTVLFAEAYKRAGFDTSNQEEYTAVVAWKKEGVRHDFIVEELVN
jgi:hypothetical protein